MLLRPQPTDLPLHRLLFFLLFSIIIINTHLSSQDTTPPDIPQPAPPPSCHPQSQRALLSPQDTGTFNTPQVIHLPTRSRHLTLRGWTNTRLRLGGLVRGGVPKWIRRASIHNELTRQCLRCTRQPPSSLPRFPINPLMFLSPPAHQGAHSREVPPAHLHIVWPS
jgi:hypothetical protein